MEFYLSRAMEITRLTEDQIQQLHSHEKKESVMREYDPSTKTYARMESRPLRCFMPQEIQDVFSLCSIKEQYSIPDNDVAQSVHNQRIRGEFKKNNFIPRGGDLSSLNVEEVHDFDEKIRQADREGRLSFGFQFSKSKRITDEVFS